MPALATRGDLVQLKAHANRYLLAKIVRCWTTIAGAFGVEHHQAGNEVRAVPRQRFHFSPYSFLAHGGGRGESSIDVYSTVLLVRYLAHGIVLLRAPAVAWVGAFLSTRVDEGRKGLKSCFATERMQDTNRSREEGEEPAMYVTPDLSYYD